MKTRDVKEALPALVCPGCGNRDPDKFRTVASGAILEGFLCMECTR